MAETTNEGRPVAFYDFEPEQLPPTISLYDLDGAVLREQTIDGPVALEVRGFGEGVIAVTEEIDGTRATQYAISNWLRERSAERPPPPPEGAAEGNPGRLDEGLAFDPSRALPRHRVGSCRSTPDLRTMPPARRGRPTDRRAR